MNRYAIMLACLMLAGCTSLAPGYRALTVAVKVTNEGGKTLASVCKAKRLKCVDKHGTLDKAVLNECLGKCPEALKQWVRVVKPAVNSGVGVTFQALETARAKKKCPPDKPKCDDWMTQLKAWACTLSSAVRQWRELLGDAAAKYLSLLGTVEGLVCK